MLEDKELVELFGDSVAILKPYSCIQQEITLPDGTKGFIIQESRTIWRDGNVHVTIHVNGRIVRREDLKNIEITNKTVKRMLAEKISGRKGGDRHGRPCENVG